MVQTMTAAEASEDGEEPFTLGKQSEVAIGGAGGMKFSAGLQMKVADALGAAGKGIGEGIITCGKAAHPDECWEDQGKKIGEALAVVAVTQIVNVGITAALGGVPFVGQILGGLVGGLVTKLFGGDTPQEAKEKQQDALFEAIMKQVADTT